MPRLPRLWPRSHNRQSQHDQLELYTHATISLCVLGGFSEAKIRRILVSLPNFSLIDGSQYAANRLYLLYDKLSEERMPAHMEWIEGGASARALRKHAQSLYEEQVLPQERSRPQAHSKEEAEQEDQRWLARWQHEIMLLRQTGRHQLELKFERELSSASESNQSSTDSNALQIFQEDSAQGTVKPAARHESNLALFDAGAAARRRDLQRKATYANNRPLITHSDLRRGYRAAAPLSSQHLPLPRVSGWDGQGLARPGTAQDVGHDGFFRTRPVE